MFAVPALQCCAQPIDVVNMADNMVHSTNEFSFTIQIKWKHAFCCNSVRTHQIATNFCTCHDSIAVVSCAKFCSDHNIRIGMETNIHFIRNRIALEKSLKNGHNARKHLRHHSPLPLFDSYSEWDYKHLTTLPRNYAVTAQNWAPQGGGWFMG